MVQAIIAAVAVCWAAFSAVLLWAFASGRFVQRAEQAGGDIEQLRRDLTSVETRLHAELAGLRTETATASSKLARLLLQLARMEQAQEVRAEFADREMVGVNRRLDAAEAHGAALQRQIDRSSPNGLAGV